MSPYTKLTETTGPGLGGKKPSWGKGDLKYNKFKKRRRRMKRQRNTTQMKQQTTTQKSKEMKRK